MTLIGSHNNTKNHASGKGAGREKGRGDGGEEGGSGRVEESVTRVYVCRTIRDLVVKAIIIKTTEQELNCCALCFTSHPTSCLVQSSQRCLLTPAPKMGKLRLKKLRPLLSW